MCLKIAEHPLTSRRWSSLLAATIDKDFKYGETRIKEAKKKGKKATEFLLESKNQCTCSEKYSRIHLKSILFYRGENKHSINEAVILQNLNYPLAWKYSTINSFTSWECFRGKNLSDIGLYIVISQVNTHHLQLLLKDNQRVAEASDGHLLWFYGIPEKKIYRQYM